MHATGNQTQLHVALTPSFVHFYTIPAANNLFLKFGICPGEKLRGILCSL